MDASGTIIARNQRSFEQIYPHPGWVEHNPTELWDITLPVAGAALQDAGLSWENLAVAGLTNQRETVILWDSQTGQPIYNAIVWQCRRTAAFCEELKRQGHGPLIQEKTGLVIDAYFSASKIRWMLQNVPQAKQLLADNRLLFGTVDTYILWKLSGGQCHVSDVTDRKSVV